MTSSRLLDFFVLEASDYIERLDGLLSATPDEQPDAASLTAQARLLRGSATMARQSPIADLASALERIGRAVRDNIIVWSPELRAALIAAVDDLKILIRGVRSWGAGDDRRTEARISELVSLYPQATKSHPTPPSTLRNASFIASESAQLATALDNVVAHPSSNEAVAVAVHRLNSLRGVAAINDTPPLAQVLGGLDDMLRPLHIRNAVPETEHLSVLITSVQLLRRFSQEIAIGGLLDPSSSIVQEFHAALSAMRKDNGNADDVIPISRLNFEDGQPQLVSAPAQPPVATLQRFRLEVAGPCELLRHQVQLARSSASEMERAHAATEMRSSLRVLRSAAEGFGDTEVVAFIDAIEPGVGPQTLSLIDELARALTNERFDRDAMHARLHEVANTRRDASVAAPRSPTPPRDIATQRPVSAPMPAVAQPPRAPTPREAPTYRPTPAPTAATHLSAPAAPRTSGPMQGVGLSEMLSAGISGLSQLESQPLSEPAPVEDSVVPIEQLLYRGRDAISRAQEIRDGIRARDGSPQTEELDELFELLDLAITE